MTIVQNICIRKNSQTTDFILEVLEKAVDGSLRVQDFIVNTEIYAKGYNRPLKKSNLSHTLRRLRLKGLISTSQSQNQLLYRLTASGRKELEIRKSLDQKDDGNWTVVVFDIPESHRKVRNVLRARLKIWQFKPLQKSVWVNKRSMKRHIKTFVDEVGLAKWVLVFETKEPKLLPVDVFIWMYQFVKSTSELPWL